jgi:hypothetical protein
MSLFNKTQKIVLLFILSSLLIFTGSLICNMFVSIRSIDSQLDIDKDIVNVGDYTLHIVSGSLAIVLGFIAFCFSVYYSTQTKTIMGVKSVLIDKADV